MVNKKTDRQTHNGTQDKTQKTNRSATRIPPKTGDDIGWSGRVS